MILHIAPILKKERAPMKNKEVCEFCKHPNPDFNCGCYERVEAEIARAEEGLSRRIRNIHEFYTER